MTNNKINDLRIPQVNNASVKNAKTKPLVKNSPESSEFAKILEKNHEQKTKADGPRLSSHAVKRMSERDIDFNTNEYMKLKDAIAKVKEKGSKESLVITDSAAYIVDVLNNKVVTAVDKGNMKENVFTKIDSTIFMN